ncbi:MAG: hypothetical protein CMM55_10800 [Rhodospirillaceae bacterium]|nr:hypothetical protein [Rhodospirillaceae bacterium]
MSWDYCASAVGIELQTVMAVFQIVADTPAARQRCRVMAMAVSEVGGRSIRLPEQHNGLVQQDMA